MNGKQFIEGLKSKYYISKNTDLAALLGFKPAYITILSQNENITANVVTKITMRLNSAVVAQKVGLIRPIIEFFPVECSRVDDETSFIDLKNENRKVLRKTLQNAKGIYSFYNSEMEIIYVGKTKNNLWTEMKSAFNRRMDHYTRYKVTHPYGKYSVLGNGQVRKIFEDSVHLYDAASYFSAYAVPD
jgi:hypothetical protein